jgi:muconolactone delta-isomerase
LPFIIESVREERGVAVMKILAIETNFPEISDALFTEALLQEEAKRAWDLYQSGEIRELYFRSDREAAVLLLECATVERARTLLSTLPLVRERLIDFELIPLRAYPGFERLFKDQVTS